MNIKNSMNKPMGILVFFLSIWALLPNALAQNSLVLYQMDSIPQSTHLNPGRIPAVKFFVGLPILSKVNANFGSSGFRLDHLGAGLDVTSRDFDFQQLLDNVGNENNARFSLSTDLLSFGMKIDEGFLGFSITDHFMGGIKFPKDLVALSNDVDREEYYNQKMFDLSTLDFEAIHYRAFSLSYAHKVDKQWSFGGRLSYLNGQQNIMAVNEDLRLSAQYVIGESTGEGYPPPEEADDLQAQGNLQVKSAGLVGLDNGVPLVNSFFSSGNGGFSLDAGAVYRHNDKMEFSFGLNNLGRLQWSKNLSYVVVEDEILEPKEEVDRIVDGLTDSEIDVALGYRTSLSPQFYAGGKYFFSDHTNIGFLLNPSRFMGDWYMAYSMSMNTRLGRWLGFSANYSVYNKSYFNLGAGFSLRVGPVQLYAVSDNLNYLISGGAAKNAHLQMGMNILFYERKYPKVIAQNNRRGRRPSVPESGAKTRSSLVKKEIADNSNSFEEEPKKTLESFLLRGVARDGNTGRKFDHVYVDLFKILPDGNLEMARTDRYLGGEFEIWLEGDTKYMILLNYNDLAFLEEMLIPIQDDIVEGVFKKDFALYEYRPEMRNEKTSKTKPELKEAKSAAKFKMISQEEPNIGTNNVEDISESSTSENNPLVLGTYYLNGSTSLRAKATHESRVLLRFAAGNEVKLVERTNKLWWKVKYQGKIGWVKAGKLQEEWF